MYQADTVKKCTNLSKYKITFLKCCTRDRFLAVRSMRELYNIGHADFSEQNVDLFSYCIFFFFF